MYTVRRPRKVDVWLPGKWNSKSHGARPVHLTITMIKWIRTSRLSIKDSLSAQALSLREMGGSWDEDYRGQSLGRGCLAT